MNGPELRDIHLPDASLWWPPAPGWWIVLLLLLVLLVLGPRAIRRLKHKPLKRLCLRELDRIRQEFSGTRNESAALGDIAALLRRTVIAYRGRAQTAASTGDAWISQLQDLGGEQRFSRSQLEILGHDRYRRDFECDVDELLQACESWINALPREKIDVSV